MNRLLLKYHRERHNDTMEELADALDMHPKTLQKKMNGSADFTLQEVRKIVKLYRLTPEQTWAVFFMDGETDGEVKE